jgi:hypothetical protein
MLEPADPAAPADSPDIAVGEAVLDLAVTRAAKAFGPRLEAAYALGSLAHGGFSSLVSDVDLGLILADPLTVQDVNRIEEVGAQVRATGAPLADRLSVFWGSRGSLTNGGTHGRFPPLDRLDLLRHGRRLYGVEVRDGVPAPSHQDLVLAAARLCLSQVARYPLTEWVRDPAGLLAQGARSATKPVLFPVRFLYTARTGEIGRNHDAVAHLVTHDPGAAADLAAAALGWRTGPAAPEDPQAIALLRDGLIPLYCSCLEVHAALARSWGDDPLAQELAAAHDELRTTS